jgi:peptidoglycan/xylan/chitin deacetylase (PgdA/CDA1 family)
MVKRRYIALAIILTIFLFISSDLFGKNTAPPLLLSFNVEYAKDFRSLESIALKEPATYFVTGEIARLFPGAISKLSEMGTIGYYHRSPRSYIEFSAEKVRWDLETSGSAIKSATGKTPLWFRTSSLEVNDKILTIARDLGFLNDSSEFENLTSQSILKEFPVSVNETGRVRFSDFTLFSIYGLSGMMALDILKENYINRLETGRPLALLLHPEIIEKYSEVLQQLITFVKKHGGRCLSYDQYLQKIHKDSPIGSIGVRLDPSLGIQDYKVIINDLVETKVADVFVLVRGKNGRVYFGDKFIKHGSIEANFKKLVIGLHDKGIKVHAWIPVLQNTASARNHPEQAMVDRYGNTSEVWVSPSHAQTVNKLNKIISELLTSFPFTGIHLDQLAYPSLDYDYSNESLTKLKQDTGISVTKKVAASTLLRKYYSEWVSWRSSQIAMMIESASKAITKADRDVQLSASLSSEVLNNYRTMEQSGQSTIFATKKVKMVAITPSDNVDPFKSIPVSHIIPLGRFKFGNQPLVLVLPFTEEIGMAGWPTYKLLIKLSIVSQGANGVVLSSYHDLFKPSEPNSKRLENIRLLFEVLLQPKQR